MNLQERLKLLEPQLQTRVIPIEHNLSIMLGYECFSGSLKGLSAYGAVRQKLQHHGAENLANKTLIDASSGNFARALALIAEYLNCSCEVIISTKATQATFDLIKVHGANVTIGGDTTLDCYKEAMRIASENPNQYILIGQLDNWGNPQGHYEFTGPRILEKVPDISEIYMAMGSGGGVNGVARYISEHLPSTKIFVTIAEPGNKIVGTFSHGIDYETPFIKEIKEKRLIAGEVPISLDDALDGMVALRKEFGLLVGLSAGGVYSAYQRRKGAGLTQGKAMILAWDGHDRWIEKINDN